MPKTLLNSTPQSRPDGKPRPSLTEVLAQPLPNLRMELAFKISKTKAGQERFTAQDLNAFLDKVSLITDVSDEIRNLEYAIGYGKPLETPDISTPEKQLVWAAGLMWLANNPKQFIQWPGVDPKQPSLTQTGLWKQLGKTPRVRDELAQHAFAIFEGTRDDQTRLRWGGPGSWFYKNMETKLVNIDLAYSLLAGLEHTRAVVYHEIGHSILSLSRTAKMEAIRQEMLVIKKKQRDRKNKLAPEDYKRLRVLDFELSLRHQLWNAAEDNCVNTYADHMGDRLQQDYGFSLNHIATTIAGAGIRATHSDKTQSSTIDKPAPKADDDNNNPNKWSDDAQKRFAALQNLQTIVNMTFFCKNGLFSDTPEGWAGLKLDPVTIGPWSKAPAPPPAPPPPAASATPPAAASPVSPAASDPANDNAPAAPDWQTDPKSFDALWDMCVGPKGIANLQPAPKDRHYGVTYFDALKQSLCDERNAIIDKIWDLHAEDIFRPLIKEFETKVEEQMKQEKDKGQDGQDDDGQDGDGQDGEGQDGEGQDGEGQEGEGQDGDGKSQGKGKGKGKPSKKKQDSQDGDPQDGAPGQGDPQGDSQDQQDGKGKGKKKVDVDDTGQMPDVDVDGDKDAEGKDKKNDKGQDGDQDGQGDGKDGDGDGEDQGESVKDLMDEAQKGKEGDGQDGKQKGDGKPSDKPSKDTQAGHGDGRRIDDLTKGNLNEYEKAVAELAGPIAEVTHQLREIRKHQIQTKMKLGKQLDLIPQDGDPTRLNTQAHQDLIVKQMTGQQITEKDFNRFRIDQQVSVQTDIELGILIDGSGSMNGDRLKRAMQAAIILYEAGKRVGIDCYIGMWGSENPPIVARPGDDPAKIGKAIATIMSGLNSGTSLKPAIEQITKEMAYTRERKSKNPLVGLTHLLIISDGDIDDPDPASKIIDTLLKSSQHVTIDVALVAKTSGVPINKLKKIQTRFPYQEISITEDLKAGNISSGMVGALLQRIRKSGSFTAVPRGVKRQTFKRAYNQMRPKP